jgi:DNA-binding MarR family transcriptional regulator
MKPITKVLKNLDRQAYYEKHLYIIHHFFPESLTPKQIEVLACFMSLDNEMAHIERFGTYCRKLVMDKTGLQPGGLGNYLKQLIEKEYIFKDKDKGYSLNPWIVPDHNSQIYQFRIDKK